MDADRSAERSPQRPSAHSAVAALALVAVMGIGLVQAGLSLTRMADTPIPSSWTDFREGRTTAAIERAVERLLPWREFLVATAGAVRYVLMRGGGDQVLLGRDGWLFLADELRPHPGAEERVDARLRLVGDVNRALAGRGVKLLVALVPDKARVHAEQLRSGAVPIYNRERYASAVATLREQGVAVVDLLGPLAAAARTGDAYYRSDTHWNQRGARIAAQAIAEAAATAGLARGNTRFRESGRDEEERVGDLVRLMGLEHAPGPLRPPGDRERPVVLEEIGGGAGAGLFGELDIPVALVGTSYSMRASFHGFLQQSLGLRVLNAARDGAGLLQSAGDYLTNDAFRESPPQMLVWEIPERVLGEPPGDEGGWVGRILPPSGSAPGGHGRGG